MSHLFGTAAVLSLLAGALAYLTGADPALVQLAGQGAVTCGVLAGASYVGDALRHAGGTDRR